MFLSSILFSCNNKDIVCILMGVFVYVNKGIYTNTLVGICCFNSPIQLSVSVVEVDIDFFQNFRVPYHNQDRQNPRYYREHPPPARQLLLKGAALPPHPKLILPRCSYSLAVGNHFSKKKLLLNFFRFTLVILLV